MRPRLFNFAAAVSLGLFVLVAAAWVQSWRYAIGVIRYETVAASFWGRSDAFGVASGRFVHFTSDVHMPGTMTADVPRQWGWVSDPAALELTFSDRAVRFGGFAWESGTFGPPQRAGDWYRSCAVPCWFLAGVLAVLPAMWSRDRYLRWQRGPAGCCPACGYDLRATPDRCPECGAVHDAAARTAA